MTDKEFEAHCKANGVHYRIEEAGKVSAVRCLDATQLPGALAAELDSDGYLVASGEALRAEEKRLAEESEKAAEPVKAATAEAEHGDA